MKSKLFLLIVLVLTLTGLYVSPARADGIIIPVSPVCDPGPCPKPPSHPIDQLVIRYHHVTVTIDEQVATTHIDQVFVNPNTWPVEGTYIFPLPQDSAVTNFTLWIDGKPVEGKVLSAEEARQQYDDVVRQQRDPALLEYAGRQAVEAHIFPIPPQGERRIELQYSQALTADNGLVRYVYPLNTEKFSQKPLESVSVNVSIHSSQTIRAVYSPSYTVDIQRSDDHNVTAGYEASNVLPDTDFSLYYSVGESEAFHLLSYRDPADPTDPDGFFLLLLAPKPETSAQPMPKDVLVVLDHSGSMDGEKFQQAQAALNFILGHLNPNDRFNVVAFSTAVDTYAAGLRPASEAPQAVTWAEKISAGGTTDINSALLEAASMADNERPTYVIFLTDGLPTVGETDSQKIIDNFAAAAPDSLRLFAFGVGYDVDTFLLDSLTAAHHGASTYVQPGDDLDKVISTFFSQISTPVLTNLSLDFGGMSTYDIYPASLPDLFLGSQIVVVGRYRDGGVANVTLSGQVEGKTQTFRYDEQAFTQDSRIQSATLDALPRLWATRKIGYLLNQVRLKGADPETIDQIVKLSIRYGIVTPYTSYLVTDSQVLGVDAQEKIANDTYQQIQSAPAAAPSGQAAVNRAAGQGGMQNAQAPAEAPASAADQVRVIGAHTFLFTNNTWTDTRFDPKTMSTIKVAFLSPDYFTLAQSSPDLADALALGERVIVMVDGAAYEVVAEGTTVAPLVIPTAGTIVQPTIVGTSIVQTTPAAPTETPSLAPEGTQVATPTSAPRAESHTCLGGLLPLGVVLIGGWWWNQRKRCQRI